MTQTLFQPRPVPVLPIAAGGPGFPVARIFCVGRNYADHAAEMGVEVDREAPFYFTKSAHAVLPSGADMPYPPGTADLHHEVELVACLTGLVDAARPLAAVGFYAVGLDMTRRDLQAFAKEKRRPWDTAKDFEGSAIIGALAPASWGVPGAQRMTLHVNGGLRQDTRLAAMVWTLPEILVHLSTLYTLGPGDIIMTGTPAGVAAVRQGDVMEAVIDGLPPLSVTVV
jgi:fumarylpyruvate hydrolase